MPINRSEWVANPAWIESFSFSLLGARGIWTRFGSMGWAWALGTTYNFPKVAYFITQAGNIPPQRPNLLNERALLILLGAAPWVLIGSNQHRVQPQHREQDQDASA